MGDAWGKSGQCLADSRSGGVFSALDAHCASVIQVSNAVCACGTYKQTAWQSGEQLLEISFDLPECQDRFRLEKASKRWFLDIASVNSALSIRLPEGLIEKVHLAAGA